MVTRQTSWGALCVSLLLAGVAVAGEQAHGLLDELGAARLAIERAQHESETSPIRKAKIRCGSWQAIGPFKDAEYGVFAREFETVFGPEEDVLARGNRLAELGKTYQSVPVAGAPDGSRRWAAHPEWTDGSYHLLASGPPPGRNEVTYLYRTITCESPVDVTAWLVTLDAAKVWLDGEEILNAPIRKAVAQQFLKVSFRIPLHAGDNRLLVKIAKCFQKNGFSFAIEGMHPIHPMLKWAPKTSIGPTAATVNELHSRYTKPKGELLANADGFGITFEPYASARWQPGSGPKQPDPSWYIKKETWQETLVASRQGVAPGKPRQGLPYKSAVLRQKDGPHHARVNVSGLRQLVLVCTVGPDDYGFDDTIWADPKLITKEGQEVSLVELTPAEVEVGLLKLFVNENHAGKKLKIGDRRFAQGFWAHAPSMMIFDLEGKYEWFETSFGLDALASRSGSSEFVIAESRESAGLLKWSPAQEAQLKLLLLRDFPGRTFRHQIERELADGIWQGVNSVSGMAVLSERYAAAILRTLSLPTAKATKLPRKVESLRTLYHQVKRFDESLRKLRRFRFDVEPLPMFDPPVLAMQQALDRFEPTAGGAAYLARLGPVREQTHAALADYEAGRAGAAQAVIRAADALDRFGEESIRNVGPIVFVRHPSLGSMQGCCPFEDDYITGQVPASIAVFDPARPSEPPRVIYEHPESSGGIWQASLSYDAQTVFFASRRPGVPGAWHIYEIGIDGQNLRQITEGDCSDVAPVELPNGQIAFASSRSGHYNVCQANRAGALYVCERDGSGLRRISANTLTDHTPAVMDDGRIMFTRWDYGIDKGVFQRHAVWAVNPDGTRLELLFGNTVSSPNAFWQCVPVPGRPEVISTFGGHHRGPYGVLGLLWKHLGVEAPRGAGFRFLTPEYPTYWDADFFSGYMDPHPLNENEYLVSYGGHGGQTNRLYLFDSRGNKTCIWEDAGNMGCYSPAALRPRKRPPVIPMSSQPDEYRYVDPVVANICPDDSKHGTFFLHDVYEGLQGHVRRGEIAALQILELVPKTRPHTGGYAYSSSPLVGRGSMYVRRLIGTVPVEEDGSAHFTAPALRDISWNALDAQGRVIQKMGSTTHIMPGERQSCIGCHDNRSLAPAMANRSPLADKRSASIPERPDWGTGGLIDYVKIVQPVWDKHCVTCHSGPRPDGSLDLSGDKTRYFNMSYDMLIDRGFIHHVPQNDADHDLTTPKSTGSLASRLITGKYLEPGHHGVRLSRDDFERIYTWIDSNVPYYHTYLYTDGGVDGARDRWYDRVKDGWFQKEFSPVFMRRCYDCHKRTIETSDAWLGYLGKRTVTSKVWTDITIMDNGMQCENSVGTFGPEYRINLTHPRWSQMLTAPLAKDSGGLGWCNDPDGRAIFLDTNDPDYRAMLGALEKGKRMLEANPRVDMLARPDPANPQDYAPSLERPRVRP